jgi:hypothetical protein
LEPVFGQELDIIEKPRRLDQILSGQSAGERHQADAGTHKGKT